MGGDSQVQRKDRAGVKVGKIAAAYLSGAI